MKDNKLKDILSDVLKLGELGSKIICHPILPAPWGLEFIPNNKAFFHILKQGSCLFRDESTKEMITLNEGDLLFIPKVHNYELLSSKGIKGEYYISEIERIHNLLPKKDKNVTKLLCGSYELKSNLSLPFFTLLPSYIHVTYEEITAYPELNSIVEMLKNEDDSNLVGGELIVSKILDILLILIVRQWMSSISNECKGWILGTLDIEVGDVLSIIHKQYHTKISIESLSKQTAMSRTKLLTKFTKLVGISPIQYLLQWRMTHAKQLLSSTELSVYEIANLVGYESEVSFSRVFKKIEKMPPGKYRQSMKFKLS